MKARTKRKRRRTRQEIDNLLDRYQKSGKTVRVFLVCGVTDMRKPFNSLYAIVEHQLHQDPMSGHIFGFCNRKRDRLKTLCWDGSGLWVCAKRLERGRFSWPESSEASVSLSAEAWAMLLGGLEFCAARKKHWYRKRA